MNANIGAVLTLVFALLVATPAGVAVVGAAGHYTLETEDSFPTPTEAVRVPGATVPVSAMLVSRPGAGIEARVTVPDGETARLELVDADGVVVDSRATDGGRSTLSTDSLATGTYYLVLRGEGSVQAAQRVVFSHHDVSHSVDPGDDADLSAWISVYPGDPTPYEAVQLVATDGSVEVVADATEVRFGLYEARLSLADYDPGKYVVYARLVGADGEYVGMSDATGLSLSPSRDVRTMAPRPAPSVDPIPTATPLPPTTRAPTTETSTDGSATTDLGVEPAGTGSGSAAVAADGVVGNVDGPTEGTLPDTSVVLLLSGIVAVGLLVRLGVGRR